MNVSQRFLRAVLLCLLLCAAAAVGGAIVYFRMTPDDDGDDKPAAAASVVAGKASAAAPGAVVAPPKAAVRPAEAKPAGDEDDGDDAPPRRVTQENGAAVVTLDAATQARSGIRVTPLKPATHRPQTSAHAAVMPLQPLIDLRMRFQVAQGDAQAAAASAAALLLERDRVRALYQDEGNMSARAYQTAQAAYLADKARADAAAANVRNLRGAVQQQYGAALARLGLEADAAQFERLLDRRDVLLQVTVPAGSDAAAPAVVAVTDSAGVMANASLVAPAAQNETGVPGRTFIYRSRTPFPAGTALTALLPRAGKTATGVLIPAAAVVWYGGQPWVYVRIAPERFARRAIGEQMPLGDGYFADDGFETGDGVVVTGAQLLLSEESRTPVSGNSCKDGECD